MRNRLPAVVMALVAGICAAGCGGDGAVETTIAAETSITAAPATTTTTSEPTSTTTTSEPTTTTTTTTTEPAPEPVSMGIVIAPDTAESLQTDLAAGAERAAADFGTDVSFFFAEAELGGALRDAAAASDVVVAVGFGFETALAEVSGEFPDVAFVRFEGVVEAPNVLSTNVVLGEAAYLVGVAAALTSETGRVGFIGGMPIPPVLSLEAGFGAGVTGTDPDAIVSVAYLGEPGEFEAFSDPEGARTAALEMYGEGVDVIFHGAARSGAGVFAAATERRAAGDEVWAIGVDNDQAADADADIAAVILTSAVRTPDGVVYWIAQQAAFETLELGRVADLGLAEGAVAYATTGGFVDGILADLDEAAAGIIAGTTRVPEEP